MATDIREAILESKWTTELVERRLDLWDRLSQGQRIEDIAREHGVSERQCWRDRRAVCLLLAKVTQKDMLAAREEFGAIRRYLLSVTMQQIRQQAGPEGTMPVEPALLSTADRQIASLERLYGVVVEAPPQVHVHSPLVSMLTEAHGKNGSSNGKPRRLAARQGG